MTAQSIVQTLRSHREELAGRGIASMALFGSIARGEDRPDSDVDVLIDLAADASLDLFELSAIRESLVEWLGRPVDLVCRADLKPSLAKRARDEIVVF